jgi:hypothetical protein
VGVCSGIRLDNIIITFNPTFGVAWEMVVEFDRESFIFFPFSENFFFQVMINPFVNCKFVLPYHW